MSGTRRATHAGSWYVDNDESLSVELEHHLSNVPDQINDSDLPIKGARAIIAPHAGYSYSGPCAAWAYKVLDLSGAKRVFVLGPSHTYYLSGCALSTFANYATPLGDLRVDVQTVEELRQTGKFADIPRGRDENEHSLEMHLPYLAFRMAETFGKNNTAETMWPPIVPILVGDNKRDAERAFGELLLPYLRDPANRFVVSSDFCHWGARFSYVAYTPNGTVASLRNLSRSNRRGGDPLEGGPSILAGGLPKLTTSPPVPIHVSIYALDHLAMDAIESGSHDAFVDNLKVTNNTVCGRHPIGVVMAALEALKKEREGGKKEDQQEEDEEDDEKEKKGDCVFTFVNYDRSSLVEAVHDSSVSYAAAYAVV